MKKDLVRRICQICNAEFFVWPSYVARGHAKFCTKTCQVKDQHQRGTNKAARKAEKHHNWKGGSTVDKNGYLRTRSENHPKVFVVGMYRPEHITVCETVLGRLLLPDEIAHHRDEDRSNNSPKNLSVMTRGQHTKFHNALRRLKKAGLMAEYQKLADSVPCVLDQALAAQVI
jgi:hypothetical protein